MADEENKQTIKTHKLYIKDASFEAPNSPQVFSSQWQPEKTLDINSNLNQVAENTYEVIASVTAVTKVDDKTAYLAEVHQAGVFTIMGFEKEELEQIQHTYCMQLLYPYACVALSDLVTRGGFPALVLEPVNFTELYLRSKQKDENAAENTA